MPEICDCQAMLSTVQASRAPQVKEKRLWAWGGWASRGYRGMADAHEYDGWPSHKEGKWDDTGEITQLSLTSIYKMILNCDKRQTIYDYLAKNTLIRNNLCMSRRNCSESD